MTRHRATDIDHAVARNIRAQRISRGLSQEELAEVLEVKFQQLQKYEYGKDRIRASQLFLISRVLDVPIARLFDGAEAGIPASHALPRNLLADPQARRFALALTQIASPKVRHALIALAEHLARADRD